MKKMDIVVDGVVVDTISLIGLSRLSEEWVEDQIAGVLECDQGLRYWICYEKWNSGANDFMYVKLDSINLAKMPSILRALVYVEGDARPWFRTRWFCNRLAHVTGCIGWPCGHHFSCVKSSEAKNPSLHSMALSAAYDGCVACVRACVEEFSLPVDVTDGSGRVDLYQLAYNGFKDRNFIGAEVLEYLRCRLLE